MFIALADVDQYGVWQLAVTSTDGFYSVKVVAIVDVSFRYGLFRRDPSTLFGFSRVRTKPVIGTYFMYNNSLLYNAV